MFKQQISSSAPKSFAARHLRKASGAALLVFLFAAHSATALAATTTTTLTSPMTPPTVYGQPVTFIASVTSSAGVPTGTVTFLDDSLVITTQPLVNGSASITTEVLTLATQNISARYNSDNLPLFSNSISAPLPWTVNPASTTTTLISSLNPSVFGDAVNFTVTVIANSPSNATPDGDVMLFNGTTLLASGILDPFGQITFSINSLAAAFPPHAIHAEYDPNAGFVASQSADLLQKVKSRTSSSVVSSVNPSVYGETVTLTATVTGTDLVIPAYVPAPPPPHDVTFFDGPTPVATVQLNVSAQATFTFALPLNTLSVGNHSFTVQYNGNIDFAPSLSSPPLVQTVNRADTTSVVVSATNPSVFGQAVTFTASVSANAPGGGLPTGNIKLFIDSVELGSTNLDAGGNASFTISTMSVGPHSVLVQYFGDGNFNGSVSPSITQTVNRASTTTDFTITPSPSVYGQAFTVDISVLPVAPGAGAPSGVVSVQADSSNHGVFSFGVPITNGSGSFSSNAFLPLILPADDYLVTATYLGDSSFNGSVSVTKLAIIAPADVTLDFTSAPNPSVTGQPVSFSVVATPTAPGGGVVEGTVTLRDSGNLIATQALDPTGRATFLGVVFTTAGPHNMTLDYASGTGNYNPKSANLIQIVNPASTSTAVTSNVNPSVFGQFITITATITVNAPGAGAPTGPVEFRDDDNTLLGIAPVGPGGSASIFNSNLSVRSHVITATYLGDPNFLGSNGSFTQVVNKADTVTNLSVSHATPPGSVYGEPITLFVSVFAAAPGGGNPTGSVEFYDDDGSGTGPVLIGTQPITGGGNSAFLTINTLIAADHILTAVYTGSTEYNGSTSPGRNHRVNKANTSASISSSRNPSVYGEPVTFTAIVTSNAPSTITPDGTVDFFDDFTGDFIGTATLSGGTAKLTVNTLDAGDYNVYAFYNGTANFNISLSLEVLQTVNRADTTTVVTSDVNPSVFGQTITLTATVTQNSPSLIAPSSGQVQFVIDDVTFGPPVDVDVTGIATITVNTLFVGFHQISANYFGTPNYNGSSSLFYDQEVIKADSSTNLTSDINPSVYGELVTFTVSVSAVLPGAGIPTGTVSIFEGTTFLGSNSLDGAGQAQIGVNSLIVGSHDIDAFYDGDDNFEPSSFSFLTQVVDKASTQVTITTEVPQTPYGETVSFNAFVSVDAPGGGLPTGTITFFDGVTDLGTATVSDFFADVTYLTNLFAVGFHDLTAVYSGDANFFGSTSPILTHEIVQASSRATVVTDDAFAVYGQTLTFTATVVADVSIIVIDETFDALAFAVFGSTIDATGTPDVPTGDVTFIYGPFSAEVTIGVDDIDPATSQASVTSSAITVGPHFVRGLYAGDVNYLSDTSNFVFQRIVKAFTDTSLTQDLDTTYYGETFTLSAGVTVEAPGSGTPTGFVRFFAFNEFDEFTFLGFRAIDAAATTTLTITDLSPGIYRIFAQYLGDANYNFSLPFAIVDHTVLKAITVTTLTSDINPVDPGQPFTLTATVTIDPPGAGLPDASAPSGFVEFYDAGVPITGQGGVPLVASAEAPFTYTATFTYSIVPVGVRTLSAEYLGDNNFESSLSENYYESVLEPTTTTLTSTSNPSVWGETVTLTATIQPDHNVNPQPSGSVFFLEGETVLAVETVFNNTASFTTSNFSVGTHNITAQYYGDSIYRSSSAIDFPQVVNQANSTTNLVSSLNPAFYGETVNFTATVSIAAPGAGTLAGSVDFFDGVDLMTTVAVDAAGQAVWTVANLGTGLHSISAVYSNDNNVAASTSLTVDQQINPTPTTTAVATIPNPSVFGESVIVRVTVNEVAGVGTPSGTIIVYVDGNQFDTADLEANGSVDFTLPQQNAGSYVVTADYMGDSRYEVSSSPIYTHTVNPASTRTALVSSSNPTVFGQSTTFTATISAVAPGAGTPAGSVEFFDGAVSHGTVALNASGAASLTVSSLSVGSHNISVNYLGSSNFVISSSAILNQIVGQSASSVAVSSSVNPSVWGELVTLTATVAAVEPGAGTPTGSVTFLDGSTAIGVGTLSGGTASISSATLAVAAHSIVAIYGGDTNFSGSTSPTFTQTVNRANTTTSIVSTVNPSVWGQSVTFVATMAAGAPGAGTPNGTVTFIIDGTPSTPVATVGGSASFSTSSLSVGSHVVSASYSGNGNFNGSISSDVTQTVNRANSATAIVSATNPSVFGQPVVFTATVSAVAPGAGTPGGTVVFTIDGTPGSPVALSGGAASFSTSALSVGAHSVSVAYSGNTNFNASASGTMTQNVGRASSASVVASNANPSVFGQTVTFTATISAAAPGAGTPTGTVTFFDNTTAISTPINLSGGSATFATAGLAVGSHPITFTYSGDGNFFGSSSGTVTQVVARAATTTALASSSAPSVVGQLITLTATVSANAPGAGTRTGTVTFVDGVNAIGVGTLNASGVATFATSSLALGTHPLTAVYSGDTQFTNSTSAQFNQVVGQASTTTVLASSSSTSVFGQTVTITATVTVNSPGTGLASGTVTFREGAAVLGTGTLSAAGQATFTTSSFSVGSHLIIGTYNGDTNFSTSASSAFTQTVIRDNTSTALVSSSNPSVVGQTVTYTATITAAAPGSGTPTGTVTFTEGATTLGSATLIGGVATFSTPWTLGAHTITATYNGDTNFNTSSTSLTQNVGQAATSTALASSVNPSVFGQNVTWTATVTVNAPGSGTRTGTVTFRDGATVLGTGTVNASGVATFATAALDVGSHNITATYGGDTNFTGSASSILNQIVGQSPTGVTIASTSNPSVVGQTITLTGTVTATAPGAGSPTGTITFIDGVNAIGVGTVNASGVATFTTSTLVLGAHPLQAVYSGDTRFQNSASATMTQTVNQASTSVALVSSVNPAVFGETVVFTATVSVNPPGAGAPTGTVTFSDDTSETTLATVALNAAGEASFSTLGLSVGSHDIVATYNGDVNFRPSSASLEQNVNKDNSVTSVASSSNPSVFGETVTFTATISAAAPGSGTPTGTVTFYDEFDNEIGTATLTDGVGSISVAIFALGDHTGTTVYNGDGNFNSSSASLTQTVVPASTSTELSSSVNPSLFGQTVTWTATVTVNAPGAGSPTGTVTFRDGAAVLGTGTIDTEGSFATFSTNALDVGSHNITATYEGDTDFIGSASSILNQVVGPAFTSTALASSSNPSVVGQTITLTGTVTANAPGAGTPTGTITFVDGVNAIGVGTMDASGVATFTTSSLVLGTHPLTAVYSGDTRFQNSTSSTLSQVVGQAATTTAVNSSAAPSVFGQTVTFVASVSVNTPGTGAPTGTVTFRDGATALGTSPMNAAGQATLSTPALSVASHNITATYNGDTNFTTSTGSFTQVVNKANSATLVASASNPSVVGESVTFTATLSAVAPGAGVPTGTVTFLDGATSLGTGTLTNGVATLSVSSLTLGAHSIAASYGGDGNFNTSTSSALSQNVGQAATSVALSSSVNPSVFGQNVTWTAAVTVNAPGAGTATGTVTFRDGATTLGSGTLNAGGTATFSTAALVVGSHNITATYGGDANFTTSVSPVLNQIVSDSQTAVALVSSVNPSVSGQDVTFTATVTATNPGAGTPSGTVTFIDGSTAIGVGTMDNAGVAAFTTSTLSVGTHGVIAIYNGDASFADNQSSVLTQTVNRAATTSVVSSSDNPSVFGQPVTFHAAVSVDAPGAGSVTGNVQFNDGATTLGTVNLDVNGEALFTTTAVLSVGAHSITVVYSGDANFSTSTSTALTQTVNKAATSTVVVSSVEPVTFGEPVQFTATVSVTAPGDGSVTGTVTFKNGGTTIGSGTVNGAGVATFTTNTLALGSHSITAEYNGDGNFQGSTSAGLTQTVIADVVTITALNNIAKEAGTVQGTFRISRANGKTVDLVVHFSVSGSATEGSDYAALGTSATIPAGETFVDITVAGNQDNLFEGDESVTATLTADATYTLGSRTTALITMLDDDSLVTISGPIATPNPAAVNQPVTFTVASNGVGAVYEWDFGDGLTDNSGNETVTHSYDTPITTTVKVTIIGAGGIRTTAELTMIIKTHVFSSDYDSDLDGINDELEQQLGTDPFNAQSVPVTNGKKPKAATVVKLATSLNFATTGKDAMGMLGVLNVADGTSFAGMKAGVDVGGVVRAFTLDSKGKAKVGGDSFSISKPKGGLSKYTMKVSKGSFKERLEDEGLLNISISKEKTNIYVQVLFDNILSAKLQPQVYSAIRNKGGKSK